MREFLNDLVQAAGVAVIMCVPWAIYFVAIIEGV
jgi:hypothetical protein